MVIRVKEKKKIMKKLMFIALALLVASCEKPILDSEDIPSKKEANVILHMTQFEQTAFTRSAQVHRAVLQELTVLIAVHAIIFVLASIGIDAENIVSQRHSATLTKFHFFFHISYYVYLFDAAKLRIIANTAK